MRTKMRTKMRIKVSLLLILLNAFVVVNSFAQVIPFVYDVENTGVDCTKPPLPTINELPVVKPLTDPFEWSDGSGRDTTIEAWTRRRSEIAAEFQNYEIGPKPVRPDTITASYSGGTLTVIIVKNGDTIKLISTITLPAGVGPFPAVIGMGGGTGSLPADLFTSRGIAQIPFNFSQVMQWQQIRGSEPINKLYPDLVYMGAYSAWSWGVSRLIDGLELVQSDLPIDLKHLAVTGCSFAGKMALFAGAFDERIALTIPQESGGGGAAAWRVSETLTGVESLGATNFVWFMSSMAQFGGANVSKLPMDHHELMAMVAPRALFVIGNPSQIWLADTSGYVSCRAAKRVWETFGVPDRMGFSFVTDHPHCALPDVQKPEIGTFLDKFLLGKDTVNTDISTNTFPDVDYSYWNEWWGTGNPVFPIRPRVGTEDVWIEAECATVGPRWNVKLDTLASNGSYVTIKEGFNSLSKAPADSGSSIYIPFTVNNDTTYYIFARVNCPSTNDDSYWLKMDNKKFVKIIELGTNGWGWMQLTAFGLTAGEHTLAITYRKDGADLDKICISDFRYPPGEMGEPAENICIPDTTTKFYSAIDVIDASDTYDLGQNYPNPFNDNTTIAFEIPRDSYVSLKVYSMLGEEIAELAGKEYTPGKHTVEFDIKNLSQGIYFYTITTDKFLASRKMIIQTK
jgi:hypothetical protein